MTSPIQESSKNFENLKFDPFERKFDPFERKFDPFERNNVLLDDSSNPDKNFCNNIKAIDKQYYFPSELLPLSEKLHINLENFSMIHLNIRSANKNFEKLKNFLSQQAPFLKFHV